VRVCLSLESVDLDIEFELPALKLFDILRPSLAGDANTGKIMSISNVTA